MATYVVCFVVLCLSAGHTVVNGNLRSVVRGALSVGCVTRWLMATYVVCRGWSVCRVCHTVVNGNLRSVFRGWSVCRVCHTVVNGNLRSVFRGALSVGMAHGG